MNAVVDLKVELLRRGKKVTHLAAQMGVSRAHLTQVLNGHLPLSDQMADRLVEALGPGISRLIRRLRHITNQTTVRSQPSSRSRQ